MSTYRYEMNSHREASCEEEVEETQIESLYDPTRRIQLHSSPSREYRVVYDPTRDTSQSPHHTDSPQRGRHIDAANDADGPETQVPAISSEDVQHVREALRFIVSRETSKRAERRRFSTQPRPDHDEADTISPIYDMNLRIGGSNYIKAFTNFTHAEFENLWFIAKPRVLRYWNVGKGRKCTHSGKDMLFMLLTVLKTGLSWDNASKLFRLSAATFERQIVNYLVKLSPHFYEIFVEHEAKTRTMANLVASGKTFRMYPCALYAVDASFQQCCRPSGAHNEVMFTYSGKHKLYGKKVEVSVSPSGYVLNVSDFAYAAKHDKTMFDSNEFHANIRLKQVNERTLDDHGPLKDQFPHEWALLADKGYQGLQHTCRAIIPIKITDKNRLSSQAMTTNENISSDRILVENWFGRQCTLWEIVSGKYRWNDSLYNPIYKICASLTNYHIRMCPLRAEDGEEYRRHLNRLLNTHEDLVERRKLAQETYRANKKARNSVRDYRGTP